MADKYEYKQRKKEKQEEVKARLDIGDARKKSTRAQESAYSESRTISPKRQRRSRSPRHNTSVFTRLRRERSRPPRHEYKSKARRESTLFKRLRSKGRLEGRSLCGFPFKCFLDAYKGYHHIQMAEEDEEKTAFITDQGQYKGIKICQRKGSTPLLSLNHQNAWKDVQKLTGKLASLKQEAEAAFRQIKEHIAKLPMLAAPKEQEELIVYLAASKEAVALILMDGKSEEYLPSSHKSIVPRSKNKKADGTKQMASPASNSQQTGVVEELINDKIRECEEKRGARPRCLEEEKEEDSWMTNVSCIR
ncbi:reverse transcriptase domain-containing protein [Tanacetum coccineum]